MSTTCVVLADCDEEYRVIVHCRVVETVSFEGLVSDCQHDWVEGNVSNHLKIFLRLVCSCCVVVQTLKNDSLLHTKVTKLHTANEIGENHSQTKDYNSSSPKAIRPNAQTHETEKMIWKKEQAEESREQEQGEGSREQQKKQDKEEINRCDMEFCHKHNQESG